MKDKVTFYERLKENNILTGIILFDVIAFFSFLVNPWSLVVLGDLDFLFGGIVGVLFALRARRRHQGYLTLCLTVGIGGAFLSSISISLVTYWIYYFSQSGVNISLLFSIVVFFSMVSGIIGTLLGVIIGLIARLKSPEPYETSNNEFNHSK